MNVLLFGATGMVGQGVLRELLRDAGVSRVITVGRRTTGERHEKLVELVAPALPDLSALSDQLQGIDACIFTLGASAARMSEAAYTVVTYDLAVGVATTLSRLNPGMRFLYVSGQGTDSTERGAVMWARVKGRTENTLLRLPFAGAFMFRPGVIVPLHGIRSRTPLYQFFYSALGPMLPWIRRRFPRQVTTTEHLGRAMVEVARHGYRAHVLEPADIEDVVPDTSP